MEELDRALDNLWIEIIRAFRLQEIVEWLNNKLMGMSR